MRRPVLVALVISVLPISVFAAGRVAPSGNAYAVGASVVSTTPVSGDFSALGGSVVVAAPVSGDDLILAGSVSSRAPVSGDVRVLGGGVSITAPVSGDLVAGGFSIDVSAPVDGSVFVTGANVTVSGGAQGPVTIYGNNVALSGNFKGNIYIFAGGRITLAPHTSIHGTLSYEAPETANIPDSAAIMGGVTYRNASYLPDVGTSRVLSLISVGFFLIVRILGALILAGLLAGLFPRFAETIVNRVFVDRPRDILLSTLLGLAITVATPVIVLLLLLTFVGSGLGLFILVLYALLLLLALIYAGILVGSVFSRRFIHRSQVLWHDGVLGMAVLSLCTLIPVIGVWIVIACTLFTAGTLLQIFFRFAFPHESEDIIDLLEI